MKRRVTRNGSQLAQCLLYPRKRTSLSGIVMSAKCHNRTHALQQKPLLDRAASAAAWAVTDGQGATRGAQASPQTPSRLGTGAGGPCAYLCSCRGIQTCLLAAP